MKKTYLILLSTLLFSCKPCEKELQSEEQIVNSVLDNWHKAAAAANFENYFNLMTDDAIFIGTDATENWNKTAFQAYAKPHFDKGKAWNFKAIERNIFFSTNGKTAWFDEDLKTWMEDCRGSGVCVKEKGEWKLAYYNLTVLIENEKIKEFIQLRKQ